MRTEQRSMFRNQALPGSIHFRPRRYDGNQLAIACITRHLLHHIRRAGRGQVAPELAESDRVVQFVQMERRNEDRFGVGTQPTLHFLRTVNPDVNRDQDASVDLWFPRSSSRARTTGLKASGCGNCFFKRGRKSHTTAGAIGAADRLTLRRRPRGRRRRSGPASAARAGPIPLPSRASPGRVRTRRS